MPKDMNSEHLRRGGVAGAGMSGDCAKVMEPMAAALRRDDAMEAADTAELASCMAQTAITQPILISEACFGQVPTVVTSAGSAV